MALAFLGSLVPYGPYLQPVFHARNALASLTQEVPGNTNQVFPPEFSRQHGIQTSIRHLRAAPSGSQLAESWGVNFCCSTARPSIAIANEVWALDKNIGTWLLKHEVLHLKQSHSFFFPAAQSVATGIGGLVVRGITWGARAALGITAPISLIGQLVAESGFQFLTYKIGKLVGDHLKRRFEMSADRYAIECASADELKAGRCVHKASKLYSQRVRVPMPSNYPSSDERLVPIEAKLRQMGLLDGLETDTIERQRIEKLARLSLDLDVQGALKQGYSQEAIAPLVPRFEEAQAAEERAFANQHVD